MQVVLSHMALAPLRMACEFGSFSICQSETYSKDGYSTNLWTLIVRSLFHGSDDSDAVVDVDGCSSFVVCYFHCGNDFHLGYSSQHDGRRTCRCRQFPGLNDHERKDSQVWLNLNEK
jgi:hypothetical protein